MKSLILVFTVLAACCAVSVRAGAVAPLVAPAPAVAAPVLAAPAPRFGGALCRLVPVLAQGASSCGCSLSVRRAAALHRGLRNAVMKSLVNCNNVHKSLMEYQ
ncbi:hypothetical protein MRX96_006358 [Rhipicephalus microplus]